MLSTEDSQLLSGAAARCSAAVLSLPCAGTLKHLKSRLLSEDKQGIWLELPADGVALADEGIAAGGKAGVSFKAGIVKAVFASSILRREPEYRINATTMVQAVLVARPDAMRAMQRRSNYRVGIPSDSELRIRVWHIPEHAILGDRPSGKTEMAIQVRNISVGGLGLAAANGDPPQKFHVGERLRIAINYGELELVVEGRPTHTRPISETITYAGIQFQKLENDLAGRQKTAALTRIVGEMQRDEVRRVRLGLTETAAA